MKKYNHSVYDLHYHVIFVTKYRRKVLTSDMMNALTQRIQVLCEGIKGQLVSLNGEPDHIHMLIDLPPQCNLSGVLNSMKTQTSMALWNQFPDSLKAVYTKRTLWSNSYFVASTGGVSIDVLKQYVESQGIEKPKRKYTKRGTSMRHAHNGNSSHD